MSKILLIYPPASSVWHLPAGISVLAGYLQEQGHDVAQRYAYIEALDYVLLQQDPRARMALDIVRSHTASIQERAWASRAIEEISTLIPGADRFIVVRNNVEYVSPYYTGTIEDATSALTDCGSNLFYDYFCQRELPRVSAFAPDICGISISDERQLIPGITLAYLIKQGVPGTKVILGGNLFSRLRHAFLMPGFERIFEACDAIIHAEGFIPMQQLASGYPFAQVAGIAFLDRDVVRINGISPSPVAFNSLPTPVFSDDAQQWCPDRVYSLYTRSNCLHACGFCAISAGSDSYLTGYRAMRPERIAEHMQSLGRRFDITDELFPVRDQLKLGEALARRGQYAEWQCYMTVTDDLLDEEICHALYQAGLRAVQLGLETLEPQTLDREGKRWNNSRQGFSLAEKYQRILANLRQASIQTHVFLIVGLPGERASASLRWLSFLEQAGQDILTIKSGRYRATRHSPDEQGSHHSEWIEVSEDVKPLRLNRNFRYIKGKGISGKQADALRDLLEQSSREHWAYGVTSVLPWWANRGRYSWSELRMMSEELAKTDYRIEPVDHIDMAFSRIRTALCNEGRELQEFHSLDQLREVAQGM